jgi:hypothetical protein
MSICGNRAPKQLAYGVIHRETDHLHLHLMISANEVERRNREWLTKAEFATVQKELEAYVLARYPELGQTLIYGREGQSKERLKTQAHEQAMKSRTGTQSRKEALKNQLHQLFERAQSADDLKRLLESGGHSGVRSRSVCGRGGARGGRFGAEAPAFHLGTRSTLPSNGIAVDGRKRVTIPK